MFKLNNTSVMLYCKQLMKGIFCLIMIVNVEIQANFTNFLFRRAEVNKTLAFEIPM